MIGLADPVRSDIAGVLQEFHDAGIRTVMVTGDQAGTASAIARQVGLSPTTKVVDGLTFLQGTNEEIAERVGRYDVFSRVSPAHKLDIVQALQRSGLTVAMTGDGTNDAPALRAADIGVAMGRHGTAAAREIADVMLAEDDLGTMVVAVRQGRAIYANMRKAIHFLVGTNSSEVFVTLGAAACGMGQPLNAGQLLWLNLVTDVAIAYALGLEPVEHDVMRQPPRPRQENIIRPSDYRRLALKSGLFSISALATHIYGMTRYGASGGGIAFSTLIGTQLLDGLSSRSETQSVWSLPENRTLTLAVTGTAALQGLVSLMPFTRRLLGLAAFDLLDLGVIAAGSLWPFLFVEIVIKPNAADRSALLS
jgi:Ca2+-transporting ATPase